MAGTLTLVGTPIGNLSDLTPRAQAALNECDFIAAEDTRVTLRLLNHLNINKPLISYYEHNKRERGELICSRIISGQNCALVTDAGMPAISDPGEDLVALCLEYGIKVQVVPGPSAVITALSVSGLPAGRFTFEGFLSVNKRNRREHLEALKDERRTMVFYEAPHKLRATLKDLLDTFGNRRVTIARELTKLHEEVIYTTLEQASEKYRNMQPRGEFVLVIEGAPQQQKDEITADQAAAIACDLMKQGHSTSEAAKLAANRTGVKKGEIYRLICKES